MIVGLRADGGASIGYGHIFRTLAIARELKRRGNKVLFITTSNEIEKVISNEFQIIQLESDKKNYDNTSSNNSAVKIQLDTEISAIRKLVNKFNIEVLVVDSYNVSEHYFIKLKEFVPFLCYVDDLNKFKFSVDILINGNIYGNELEYKSYYPQTKFLLGAKYTILRDEFQNPEPIMIKRQIKTISILIGGSDQSNFSKRIINITCQDSELKKFRYNVFIGPGFTDDLRKMLKKLKFENIIVHEDLVDIKNILTESDIAIAGGGSALYELASCGVPTLSIIFAKNQEQNVETLYKLNCIETLGWYDKVRDDEIKNKILALTNDFERRVELQQNQLELIDGKGTERIVDEIERVYNQVE